IRRSSRDRFEGQQIAALALSNDRFDRDVMEEVDRSKRLACRGIREMDLPERALHREERVAQGDRRMGQPAGVDDRGVEVALVQPIDEGTLVVRLEEGDVESELRSAGRDLAVDVVEGVVAVDLRLACPD